MLPNKALKPSKSFWVTNDKINKDNKKNYIPKYSCIYSKKDQKELNYSVLFPRKITLMKRGTQFKAHWNWGEYILKQVLMSQ